MYRACTAVVHDGNRAVVCGEFCKNAFREGFGNSFIWAKAYFWLDLQNVGDNKQPGESYYNRHAKVV